MYLSPRQIETIINKSSTGRATFYFCALSVTTKKLKHVPTSCVELTATSYDFIDVNTNKPYTLIKGGRYFDNYKECKEFEQLLINNHLAILKDLEKILPAQIAILENLR